MADTLTELRKDFDRTLKRIAEYEAKEQERVLDLKDTKEYREWLSLSANIAERIFLLEARDRGIGFDGERSNRVRQEAFGDWLTKVDKTDSKKRGAGKDYREK
jgi:hypothetical protein